MTTKKIDEAIKFLEKGDIAELLKLLTYERQKSILEESGKKIKLAPAVKKIISNNPERPVLETVQYNDERPFICDGYILIRWNKEQPELKCFTETHGEKALKCDNLLPNINDCTEYKLTEDDKAIINNLDKYIKLYKTKGILSINVFNKTYDAKQLKMLFDVIGTDFNIIYTLKSRNPKTSLNMFMNDNLTAIILPLNIENEETKNRTKNFLEVIKQ